jgi:hypothetical protein
VAAALRAGSGGRGKLHAGASRLAEPDGDRLLRGSRSVLAFADVVHLLANELASPARGALSLAPRLSRALDRLLFRHRVVLLSVMVV